MVETSVAKNLKSAREWFAIADVGEKVRTLPQALSLALADNAAIDPFAGQEISIARDVSVVRRSQLPDKPKISTLEGQARLLHDLASIELQAMELGVRTLVEFRQGPIEFRQQLADITLGEARHFGLCLDGLHALGYEWGHWSVHTSLLAAVAAEDSLLDRILIVHRYLEGAGLDAGEGVLRKLTGIGPSKARPIMQTIRNEEVDHVLFGSRWYHRICQLQGLDAADDFSSRISIINRLVPRREKINIELRKQAGFTDHELRELEDALMAAELTYKNSRLARGERDASVSS